MENIKQLERHPSNAEGDFFVENDVCLACDAPNSEAPELMDYAEDGSCYFKRQPETEEELEHAINAVCVSCVVAVLYSGDDPKIIEKIKESNHELYTDTKRLQPKKISIQPKETSVFQKISNFILRKSD